MDILNSVQEYCSTLETRCRFHTWKTCQNFDVIHYYDRQSFQFGWLVVVSDVGQEYTRGCGHLPIISIQTK